MENAQVTAINGDQLTIDTSSIAPNNQPLAFTHPAGSVVCLVEWVTYSLASNVLYVHRHHGSGDTRQPVAEDITAMTISIAGKLLTINLTASTKNPDRTTGQYFTTSVTNNVLLRN